MAGERSFATPTQLAETVTSRMAVPRQILLGFSRVSSTMPHRPVDVAVTIRASALRLVGPRGEFGLLRGTYTLHVGGRAPLLGPSTSSSSSSSTAADRMLEMIDEPLAVGLQVKTDDDLAATDGSGHPHSIGALSDVDDGADATPGCHTDMDCNLNGRCLNHTAGACQRDAPWTGRTCGVMGYSPNTPASAKDIYPTSNPSNTWGGPIVGPESDGKYRLTAISIPAGILT